jgi:hypothetical protein
MHTFVGRPHGFLFSNRNASPSSLRLLSCKLTSQSNPFLNPFSTDCSIHGTSVRSGSACSCTCLPGFFGDGQTCEVCNENARPHSFPNGTSTCLCTSPYVGDGYHCYAPKPSPNPGSGSGQPAGGAVPGVSLAPQSGTLSCSTDAKLVMQSDGNWGCKCQPPAQGNGTICLICDGNAKVVNGGNGRGLECRCNAGFEGSGLECSSGTGSLHQNCFRKAGHRRIFWDQAPSHVSPLPFTLSNGLLQCLPGFCFSQNGLPLCSS